MLHKPFQDLVLLDWPCHSRDEPMHSQVPCSDLDDTIMTQGTIDEEPGNPDG